MNLIIAEKPSLAKNIALAIPGTPIHQNGYIKKDDYYVTYAYGHLFALWDIDSYTNTPSSTWDLTNLPFFPDKFKFGLKRDPKTKRIDEGIKAQFDIICKLMNDPNIDTIIHAGDSDREGEVIIRLIIQNGLGDKTKKIMRLWLPEQTEQSIRNGLATMQPDSEKDTLFYEGLARTYIDWLYGINLTRLLSVKAGRLLRVGRILIPIVSAIHDREMEIKDFKPTKFWKIESSETTNDECIKLTSPIRLSHDQRDAATSICQNLNMQQAYVSEINMKPVKKKSGKLFSLSKLQGLLGTKFHMSLKASLQIIQKLYENGYITYPRTNTEYLAEGEKEKIKDLIDIYIAQGNPVKFKDSKQIFDNTKIESHSALTPTVKVPGNLSAEEQQVYDTIKNRFLSVFCSEDCIFDQTTMTIAIGDESYRLTGEVMKSPGFLQFEPSSKPDKLLPKLKKGDSININFQPVEGETSPPKRYTVATLNAYLKNPFRTDDATEDEDYKALLSGLEIGTEATRTGIIENAISNEYISLKNNIFYLEYLGEYLISCLKILNIDMSKEKTVYMSKLLKQVYHQNITVKNAILLTEKEVVKCFASKSKPLPKLPDELLGKEKIGICPKCGKLIYENKASFSCSGYKEGCKFALFKTDKYFASLGVPLEKSIAMALLAQRKVKLSGLVSKSGKKYSATVVVNFTDQYPKYTLFFPKKRKGKK